MQLTQYSQVSDLFVNTACACLTAGYDPYMLYGNDYASKVMENGYAIDDYNYDAWQIQRIIDALQPLFILDDIKLMNLSFDKLVWLRTEQIKEIIMNFPFVDMSPYINTEKEFNTLQLSAIRKGLQSGVDISIYANPELDGSKMLLLKDLLVKNIDVKPFLTLSVRELNIINRFYSKQDRDVLWLSAFKNEQLDVIYNLYQQYGSNVLNILKNNIDTYKQFKDKTLEMLILGELFNFFKPEQYDFNSERIIARVKLKLKQIALAENMKDEKFISDTIADPSCDYNDRLITLFMLHSKGVKLTPFLILLNKYGVLFDEAVKWYQKYGILPEQYLDIAVSTEKKQLTSDRIEGIIRDVLASHICSVIDINADKYTTEQLGILYNGYRKKLDISKCSDPALSVYEMQVILTHLEKGIDLSPYITPARKLKKYSKHVYFFHAEILNEIIPLFTKYGVNFFDEYEQLARAGVDAGLMKDTFRYIRKLYQLAERKEGIEKEQTQAVVEKLLDVTVYQNRCFSEHQLLQIHLGILHNVDVSIYAKPEYSVSVMQIIREGLVKGINLIPYIESAQSKPSTLRHIIRIASNRTPFTEQTLRRFKTVQKSSGFYPAFAEAVNVVQNHRQEQREVKP